MKLLSELTNEELVSLSVEISKQRDLAHIESIEWDALYTFNGKINTEKRLRSADTLSSIMAEHGIKN